MRAFRILLQQLSPWLPTNTRSVQQWLLEALQAALEANSLSVTELGHFLPGSASLKNKVKTAWRWLRSDTLADQVTPMFRALAHCLLHGVEQPQLLVDWTPFNGYYLLCCAVVHDGRALPIYIELRPAAEQGKPAVERKWLETLARDLLPAGCRPLLCTDAGFRSDWFNTVEGLGFDYIGRLQPGVQMQMNDANADIWINADAVGRLATSTPEDLGKCLVCKGRSVKRRVVRFRGRAVRHPSQKRGATPKGTATVQKHRRQAERGWVLVTSLSSVDAAGIVALYARRMEVEELFRSIKSRLYGQGADQSRSCSAAVLLGQWVLACLGSVALQCVGVIAESQGWHRWYQTNTVRERRVLSLMRLGQLVLRHHDLRQITPKRMSEALADIRSRASWHDVVRRHAAPLVIFENAQGAQAPAMAA